MFIVCRTCCHCYRVLASSYRALHRLFLFFAAAAVAAAAFASTGPAILLLLVLLCSLSHDDGRRWDDYRTGTRTCTGSSPSPSTSTSSSTSSITSTTIGAAAEFCPSMNLLWGSNHSLALAPSGCWQGGRRWR